MKIGKKVEHILNGECLLILKEGKEQLLCRTKDFREIWFYPFELKGI